MENVSEHLNVVQYKGIGSIVIYLWKPTFVASICIVLLKYTVFVAHQY